MLITLLPQELDLLKKYAHQFKDKSGETYSAQYIMLLLAKKYEQNLNKDLTEIMEYKLRESKERQAKKGKLE